MSVITTVKSVDKALVGVRQPQRGDGYGYSVEAVLYRTHVHYEGTDWSDDCFTIFRQEKDGRIILTTDGLGDITVDHAVLERLGHTLTKQWITDFYTFASDDDDFNV